jgi:hypothetical protein
MASPTRNPTGEQGKCHEQKERDRQANHGIRRRVDQQADGEVARCDNQKEQRSKASHVDHPLWFDLLDYHAKHKNLGIFQSRVNRRKDARRIGVSVIRRSAAQRWWVNENPAHARLLT